VGSGITLTDGMPAGEPVGLDYKERPELSSGTGTIHGFTSQSLDNGYTRFTLDYTMPKGMRIFVFDPPNGEKIGLRDDSGTSGSRSTLVFDVETALLSDTEIENLTVNFYTSDDNRFLVVIPVGQ